MARAFLLILLACTMCIFPAVAGPKEPTAEMLKELQEFKIKYIIQEIDLASDKQDDFTKMYSQYENDRVSLFRDLHAKAKSIKCNKQPTDTDYAVAAESIATAKAREGDLEKRYFNKFKTILSSKQLYLLKRAEQKFDRKLNETRRQSSTRGKNKK